jgi:hypothetical protein
VSLQPKSVTKNQNGVAMPKTTNDVFMESQPSVGERARPRHDCASGNRAKPWVVMKSLDGRTMHERDTFELSRVAYLGIQILRSGPLAELTSTRVRVFQALRQTHAHARKQRHVACCEYVSLSIETLHAKRNDDATNCSDDSLGHVGPRLRRAERCQTT